MRSKKDHTVFQGECVGQVLELELLRREVRNRGRRRRIQHATLGKDNQAGMLVLQDLGPGTGQYLVDGILEEAHRVWKIDASMEIEIVWTPEHKGIPGNEWEDREAKRAAGGSETDLRGLSLLCKTLPCLKAAIVRQHKDQWCHKAEGQFMKLLHYQRLQAMDPAVLRTKTIKDTLLRLPCRHASLLIQLHTGHCSLNCYLYKIRKVETPICSACREVEETVAHYLLDCMKCTTERSGTW